MFLENECESIARVGEMRVKADESGSPHTVPGPVGGNKQLMGSQWGADDGRKSMGWARQIHAARGGMIKRRSAGARDLV